MHIRLYTQCACCAKTSHTFLLFSYILVSSSSSRTNSCTLMSDCSYARVYYVWWMWVNWAEWAQHNTVDRENFAVKIFLDSMASPKIKPAKIMRTINDSAVRGRLSKNYLTWKFIVRNICNAKYSRITVIVNCADLLYHDAAEVSMLERGKCWVSLSQQTG